MLNLLFHSFRRLERRRRRRRRRRITTYYFYNYGRQCVCVCALSVYVCVYACILEYRISSLCLYLYVYAKIAFEVKLAASEQLLVKRYFGWFFRACFECLSSCQKKIRRRKIRRRKRRRRRRLTSSICEEDFEKSEKREESLFQWGDFNEVISVLCARTYVCFGISVHS